MIRAANIPLPVPWKAHTGLSLGYLPRSNNHRISLHMQVKFTSSWKLVSKAGVNFCLHIIVISKCLNIKTYYLGLGTTNYSNCYFPRDQNFKKGPHPKNCYAASQLHGHHPPNYHLNARTSKDILCSWELQDRGPTCTCNHFITSHLGQIQQPHRLP